MFPIMGISLIKEVNKSREIIGHPRIMVSFKMCAEGCERGVIP